MIFYLLYLIIITMPFMWTASMNIIVQGNLLYLDS